MINPIVSIIVPFYNPGHYFYDLLESLSKQSYKNIEIILVDDGSDINYNNIAKDFVRFDENRVLITKENGGVASARQVGLEKSKGELIIHADADDLVPEFAIERLVKRMIATNSDIVIGGYVIKRQKCDIYIGVNVEESYWSFVEGLLLGKYHGSLCNKLIKRSLYQGITFEPKINYMEDKLLLAKIFSFGPYNISFLNESVYVYRMHSGSVTYNISFESIDTSVLVVDKIAYLYRDKLDSSLIDIMINQRRVFEVYQKAKKGVSVFSADDKSLIKNSNIPLRYKLVLWLLSKDLLWFVKILSNFNKS